MTVIIVNDFGYINGGASQVAIESALLMREKGHDVIFFTAVAPIDERLQDAGIKIVCIDQKECLHYKNKLTGAITGLWNWKAYKQLDRLLQQLDVNTSIVHVHVWIKALSSSIFAAIAKNQFKLVVTAHDYFLACPDGGFYNYPKQKICPYHALSRQCICTNCDKRNYAQKLYRVIRQIIQNHMIRKNNVNVIFVSHFSENILGRQISYPYRGEVIINPVRAIGRTDKINKIKDIYIYLGRLSPEKGADLFCEAIYRLGLQGVLIGDGDCRRQLEHKYEKYNGLQFIGWLNHDEIGIYLQRGKALVVPSRLYETAVLTIPEAQTNYDIPVIVGDQCAGKEFMRNGMIFQSGNLNSLMRCIDKFEKTNMANINRAAIMEASNQSASPDLLVQMYKEILKSRR